MLRNLPQIKKITLLIIGLIFIQPAVATPSIDHATHLHPHRVPVQIKLSNGELKAVSLFKVSTPIHTKALKPKKMFFNLARHYGLQSTSLLPSMVDLGMNSVPVLDQGPWGSCATFATTAAIDAYYPLRGKKRISELCNLALGKTLNVLPDTDGGWNGSVGDVILTQINHYGFLPLSYQEKNGCGGLKEYPVNSAENNGTAMSVALFTKNSIKTFTEHHWKTLPPVYTSEDDNNWHGNETLDAVRKSLAAGYRVTFGVLVDPVAENVGIIGRYHGVTDVFVLTEDIISDIIADQVAGHAMVITGYDDYACAVYTDKKNTDKNNTSDKKFQCGLLKLRNSWGPLAGDKGDFYMTYDYFKYLTMESFAIGAK